MSRNHHWVSYVKGRISIKGCAKCGQIMLPSNESQECNEVSIADNQLIAKGYRIVPLEDKAKVA
ncbi:hypothetical protein [Pleionea sp. CnH1-48]|uniref:hypothetical protein n=1 Tax=Pleionea sp. CnH1-48 TaxID=2954494 RepID=UPI002097BECF|nr:hypothetical protein [Pleionea sp. CnH1-48]MCO7226700.1 hypothetical protein [Pleionea sp. CnH1-48]